jgi:glycosyltransferase involved in cell wall biosynthesis
MLIDVTRLFYSRLVGRRPTGVDRVSLEYVRHYGGGSHAVLCRGRIHTVLPADVSGTLFAALLDAEVELRRVCSLVVRSAFVRALSPPPVADSILFNTGHLGLENPGWARPLRLRGARPVFFVHDLIPIDYPEYCRPGGDRLHASRMRNVLAIGCGIIANSRGTLASLECYGELIGLRCPPAVVAPLAPLPLLEAGPRPMGRPYFVILGTIEPRKNHWLVLQVWRRLVARWGDAAPCLVVIGRRGWECENVVDLLERGETLRGAVFERNDCSDSDVAMYLRHAQALLMPSFAEGFGLPVVEALAAGIPVIASDLDVFHEIAGNVPEYADPLDGPRWEDLIIAYTGVDSELRREQLQRLGNLRIPTWPEHFAVVDAFLQSMRTDRRPPG